MAKTLTGDQLAKYAAKQITAAHQILAAHHDVGGGNCYCSRPWPCSITMSCHSTIRHYQDRLARLDATLVLPQVSNLRTTAHDNRPWWIRLIRTVAFQK